jgi:hypothetical protein
MPRYAHCWTALLIVAMLACGERKSSEHLNGTESAAGVTAMTKEQILEVARQDAMAKYRDLSLYDVTATQTGEGWHVVYTLKDKTLDGGGPEYTIDPSGKILSKKYSQ